MAEIKPMTTLLRMYLNCGEEDGKAVIRNVSVRNVKSDISGDDALALADALADLLEPSLEYTKHVVTSLVA